MQINKLFQLNNYIYAMSLYHVIAILYFFSGIKGFKLQTLVGIDESLIHSSKGLAETIILHEHPGAILILSAILAFIDLIFLMILSYDFHGLNLTIRKIGILEIVIFILALLFSPFRGAMLFFSLNTLQIFIFYHIALWFEKYYIPIPKYIIVCGSYILLLKIIIYPI